MWHSCHQQRAVKEGILHRGFQRAGGKQASLGKRARAKPTPDGHAWARGEDVVALLQKAAPLLDPADIVRGYCSVDAASVSTRRVVSGAAAGTTRSLATAWGLTQFPCPRSVRSSSRLSRRAVVVVFSTFAHADKGRRPEHQNFRELPSNRGCRCCSVGLISRKVTSRSYGTCSVRTTWMHAAPAARSTSVAAVWQLKSYPG